MVKYAYVGFNSFFGEGVEGRSPLLAWEIRAAGDTVSKGNLCSPLGVKHFKALKSLKLGSKRKKKKKLFLSFCFWHRTKWPIFSLRCKGGRTGRSKIVFPLTVHQWDPFMAKEPRDAIILQITYFSCFSQKISQVHTIGRAPKVYFCHF